jgi:SAM-dependent methyltransferase
MNLYGQASRKNAIRVPNLNFQIAQENILRSGIKSHGACKRDAVTTRVVVPELMDDPGLAPQNHERALAGLARLNRWSRSEAGLWDVLRNDALRKGKEPYRVLDLATGSGDLPIGLTRRAVRSGLAMTFAGCDVSPIAIAVADAEAKRRGVDVKFFALDVLREPLPAGYDAIITSLFLHHLPEADAIELLRKMADTAERLIVVFDLSRTRWNLGLVTLASRILTRSSVVHHDGPASVRAAFTMVEARDLAERAGLTNANVTPWWPCRWRLTWRKHP